MAYVGFSPFRLYYGIIITLNPYYIYTYGIEGKDIFIPYHIYPYKGHGGSEEDCVDK